MYAHAVCDIICLAGRNYMKFATSAGDKEVIVMTDYELIMVLLAILGLLLAAYKRK